MQSNPERNLKDAKRNYHIFLVVIGITIIFIGFMIWFDNYIQETYVDQEFTSNTCQAGPTNQYEIAAIEGNAGIKLPPSARDICEYTDGFRDIFTLIRFTINAEELEEFLESTICNEPLIETVPSAHKKGSADPDWWMPNEATYLMQCSASTEHFHQKVLIDVTDTNYFVIYVRGSTY